MNSKSDVAADKAYNTECCIIIHSALCNFLFYYKIRSKKLNWFSSVIS